MSKKDPLLLGSWSSLGTDIAFASERGTKSNLPVTKDGQGFKIGLKLTRSTSVFETSGQVALGVTTQGSHRSGRAHISASGSSTDRFAIHTGPRGYPSE